MNSSSSSSRFRRIMKLLQKELRETLRDRRTVITLVLMPLLVYPLMGLVFHRLMFLQFSAEPVELRLAYESVELAQRLGPALKPLAEHLGKQELKILVPNRASETISVEEAVYQGEADLGIRYDLEMAERDNFLPIDLVIMPHSVAGKRLSEAVEKTLQKSNTEATRKVLAKHNISFDVPYRWKNSILPVEDGGPVSLTSLIPLILLLMTVTGAVYPAIDLTAGERERGTLEPLIAAPVPATEMLLGKYFAVCAVALLTATMNLVAMTATLMTSGLDVVVFGSQGISIAALSAMFGLLMVLIAFFSAVLLAITSCARSFREAQAYLIPVMLVSLAPGIASLLPGIELGYGLAVTPIANIVLLSRDLLEGKLRESIAVVVLVSMTGYAVASLIIASKLFGRDAFSFGSEGTWIDLFKRVPTTREVPSVATLCGTVATLVPMFLLLGSLPNRWEGLSISTRLLAGAALTVALFVAWPMFITVWRGVRIPSAWAFTSPNILAWCAAVLLGLSMWAYAYELQVLVLPRDRLERLAEFFRPFEEKWKQIPFSLSIFCLAIIPAVCEELFFRGYLYTGIEKRSRPAEAILWSSILFGAMHVMVQDSILWERFLPTTFLGLVLAVIRYRSGSVLPGILMHVMNNALATSAPRSQEFLKQLGLNVESQAHLPMRWLMVVGVISSLGLLVLFLMPRPQATKNR